MCIFDKFIFGIIVYKKFGVLGVMVIELKFFVFY